MRRLPLGRNNNPKRSRKPADLTFGQFIRVTKADHSYKRASSFNLKVLFDNNNAAAFLSF
jgi:hypothetical protein